MTRLALIAARLHRADRQRDTRTWWAQLAAVIAVLAVTILAAVVLYIALKSGIHTHPDPTPTTTAPPPVL